MPIYSTTEGRKNKIQNHQFTRKIEGREIKILDDSGTSTSLLMKFK